MEKFVVIYSSVCHNAGQISYCARTIEAPNKKLAASIAEEWNDKWEEFKVCDIIGSVEFTDWVFLVKEGNVIRPFVVPKIPELDAPYSNDLKELVDRAMTVYCNQVSIEKLTSVTGFYDILLTKVGS